MAMLLGLRSMAKAQPGLNVTGNSALINGMTFDYSIGEMVLVSTEKTSQFIITQGLLQPQTNKPTESTGSAGHLDPWSESIRVYPNPSDNLVFVDWTATNAARISYRLYDAAGKVVLSNALEQTIGSNKISLELQALSAGTYYLMLDGLSTDGQQQSFKIQKVR